ncbi:MAG TPA: hypothetical protein VL995_05125 [Cellvibrio sp.]|nr:hypothetical protein [Cellvibrio sp.]
MQIFSYIKMTSFAILLIVSTACSAQNQIKPEINDLEIYNNIQSEISFRSWDTKGLGNVTEKNALTVLKAKNGKGDFIVLRWSKDKTQFTTEIYRAKPDEEEQSSWSLVNGDEKKTLSYQHGDMYMIHQLIAGKDGGQKSEIFHLTKQ